MAGTIALLQARIGSSRLPGKVLMPLQGKAIIEIMLERLEGSKELDGIVVVSSTEPENDALAYIVEGYQIPCFRGSENDVLDRYYQAALFYEVEHIVRLTGDCPLIDPKIVDKAIHLYHRTDIDLVISKRFPDGLDICIFSFDALASAWKNAKLASDREHVIPWILKHTNISDQKMFVADDYGRHESFRGERIKVDEKVSYEFKGIEYNCSEDLSDERWTIDEAADYVFLKKLAKAVPVPIVDATWQDILQTLRKHPEIRAINGHIPRDEGYSKSLEEDKKACL